MSEGMDRRAEIYLQVGEALHLAQTLELYVSVLINILNNRFNSRIDKEKLIVKEDKKTMGKLITELKKHASIDDTGSNILREALDKRNYIAHHFYNQNTYAFSVQEIYESTMERLKEDSKTIATAVAMTQGFVEGFCHAFSIELNDVLVEQDI